MGIEDSSQMVVIEGEAPLPWPFPDGRGRIEATTGGRATIAAAAFAGQPDLLRLIGAQMWDEVSTAKDELPTASGDDMPASVQAAELAALDVAFAGGGRSVTVEWEVAR